MGFLGRPKRDANAAGAPRAGFLKRNKSRVAAIGLAAAIATGVGVEKVRYNNSVAQRADLLKTQRVNAPREWAALGTRFWQPKRPFPFSKANVSAMNFIGTLARDLAKSEGRAGVSSGDLKRVVETIEGNRRAIGRVGFGVWKESLIKQSNLGSSELNPGPIIRICEAYENAPVETSQAVDALGKMFKSR